MGFISDFFDRLISFAIFLTLLGGLESATLYFAGEATKAQKRGLISLSDLNYQLQGQEKYCSSIGWLDKKRCPDPSKGK